MKVLDDARALFFVTLVVLWLAAWIGASLSRWLGEVDKESRPDFNVVVGATLTLLGLIIGFSFSMAIARFDQRKNCEAAEANAIGTAYLRSDLLPAEDGAKIRDLLKTYIGLRLRFYTAPDRNTVQPIRVETDRVGAALWKTVSSAALAQPNPATTLAVSGIGDVLSDEGLTQASFWNRIPPTAWSLMFAIAIFCNGLIGYGARRVNVKLFVVLPLVVATSFFLIADIDSPRSGVIVVHPQNLELVQAGLK